ncbi:hypothetical protein ACFS5M_06595 [Lacinutrix iliipiscaria]|uniref:Uncharacterized protein n=1 Tax=Lacinutrix iliipiscaria TaxID=1230532 RepID=A0ABW5WQ31_9FLAO
MKQIIFKITAFSFLILISIFFIFSLADGTTDAMYFKFTTPKQNAMIIGSSRAAQGLHPQELNPVLQRDDIFNYAFQIPSSPYGEIYLESIKRKVSEQTINGLFILEVNPWTTGYRKGVNDEKEFIIEEGGFLENTKYVTMNPNIEYLYESYNGGYINILKDKTRKGAYQTFFVENNGWLHVTIESDLISKAERTAAKMKTYRNKLIGFNGMSEYRKASLVKTITFLKQYGKVYLVRIPVIEAMLEIENELQSNFNDEMNKIAIENQVSYINMMPENKHYDYTDGNHLDIDSGAQFSIDLAEKIKTLQNQ